MVTKPKPRAQDPYSLRCVPQVYGASHDTIVYVRNVVETEINSITNSPTVFSDDDMVTSGGNFRDQPLAVIYDFLAITLAELGNISEHRIVQLILGLRNLSEFLVTNPRLSDSFMTPQYVAVAMVGQDRAYCHSAASGSIVSSNDQEDHVSMGVSTTTRLMSLIANLYRLFGIELFNTARAIESCRPVKTSEHLEGSPMNFHKVCPHVEDNIVMYEQMNEAEELIRTPPFEWSLVIRQCKGIALHTTPRA